MKKTLSVIFVAALAALLLLGLSGCSETFMLESTAFKNGERIPIKHCRGYDGGRENISPSFNWVNPPADVQSFALIIHDSTSSRKWIHWAVFNIPANCSEIVENASGGNMPVGSIELNNQFRTYGYGGPEPPKGAGEHTYIAALYALNTAVINEVNGFMSFTELNSILEGKVIEKAEISGIYSNE